MEQPDAGDRQGAFPLLSDNVSTIFYFAYGSNMSTPRIRRRIQSATMLSSAYLAGHSLRFHKKSIDGSAKCDIKHTQIHDDRVHGVVYEIPVREKTVLDRYEGLGNGYEDKQVSIVLPGGETRLVLLSRGTKPYRARNPCPPHANNDNISPRPVSSAGSRYGLPYPLRVSHPSGKPLHRFCSSHKTTAPRYPPAGRVPQPYPW